MPGKFAQFSIEVNWNYKNRFFFPVETILNEHPVTIYPGRSSPTRRNSSNRKSIGSSRDLGDSLSKSNDDSSECEDDDDDEDVDDTDDPSKLITIADTSDLYRKNKSNIVLSDNIIIKSSSSLSNRRSLMASEDDEFSDDSLENQPQVPTTIILPNEVQQDTSPIDETGIFPPPPLDDVQLSCSAPAKCSPGIAWEINLNEPIDSKYIKVIDMIEKKIKIKKNSSFVNHTDFYRFAANGSAICIKYQWRWQCSFDTV